jgi:hypothetical protein
MGKKIQKLEMIQKYLPARGKSLSNSTTQLNGDELKSLLQYHKRKCDSPIKTRIADQRIQWSQQQHRVAEDPTPSLSMPRMEQNYD